MPVGSIGESGVEESERATCRADVAFFVANELDALRNSESFIVDLSLLKSDASFLEIDRCVLHAGLDRKSARRDQGHNVGIVKARDQLR